jgi:hypothetical protein
MALEMLVERGDEAGGEHNNRGQSMTLSSCWQKL